jgi:hypothetical protein
MVPAMNPAAQRFLSVALPIMVTLVVTVWTAQWSQNKRFDDLKSDINRRLDDIVARLGRVETKLDGLEERITRLEERTSHLRR